MFIFWFFWPPKQLSPEELQKVFDEYGYKSIPGRVVD